MRTRAREWASQLAQRKERFLKKSGAVITAHSLPPWKRTFSTHLKKQVVAVWRWTENTRSASFSPTRTGAKQASFWPPTEAWEGKGASLFVVFTSGKQLVVLSPQTGVQWRISMNTTWTKINVVIPLNFYPLYIHPSIQSSLVFYY